MDAHSGAIDRRWDTGRGLSSAPSLSVIATATGAWVGTTTGLTFVRDTPGTANEPAGTLTNVFNGGRVWALVMRGDSLWIGTDLGVMVLPPGETAPRRLRSAESDRRLTQPIVSIASSDSVVVLGTPTGEVLRIDVRSGAVLDTVSYVATRRVGRVNGLAIDERTVWVAGDLGVAVIERATRTERFIPVGPDIPGEANGVALSPEFAWIAARDGAVRLRRTANGTIW
jgi:ligand-binding sensor domain-containing protein